MSVSYEEQKQWLDKKYPGIVNKEERDILY